MGAVAVLTTASKAATTGGTFADSLTANTSDSLSVASFTSGRARIVAMWGVDSDSVAEVEVIFTRPDSTHDQANGFRFAIPALTLGGAAIAAGFPAFQEGAEIEVYLNDTATIKATTTASDDILVSYLILYDDLPGAGPAQFTTWDRVQALRLSNVGIQLLPVASATPGAYGATRALTTDDNRFHANTWYALLGATCQTPVTTVALTGPPWGGQRIGLPMGAAFVHSSMWFKRLAEWHNRPLIPYFNAADAANINVVVADGEASTSPKVDFNLVELTGRP